MDTFDFILLLYDKGLINDNDFLLLCWSYISQNLHYLPLSWFYRTAFNSSHHLTKPQNKITLMTLIKISISAQVGCSYNVTSPNWNTKFSILIKYVLNSSAKSIQIKPFLSAAVRTGQFKIWLSRTVGVKIVQIFCTNDKETIIFQRIFMIEYFIFELGCSNSEKSVKMRGKKQAYTHVVKSTLNQALA